MAHDPALDKRTTELDQKPTPELGDEVVIIDHSNPDIPVNKRTPYSGIIATDLATMTALAIAFG